MRAKKFKLFEKLKNIKKPPRRAAFVASKEFVVFSYSAAVLVRSRYFHLQL